MPEDTAPHPMDHIPVRPLAFDVDGLAGKDPVWSRSCPEFSILLNALGLHVPYFERYLIRVLNRAKAEVQDPKLREAMSAIIGQEAHHAKNFLAYNKFLGLTYPKAPALDDAARDFFVEHLKIDTPRRQVGFTAGYETFTFLAGMIVLDNYDAWFSDSEPTIKAMWVWHQVEEVEHGAVAFDVYKALYGRHEWYRKYMIAVALKHIVVETVRAYFHMCKVSGFLRNPWRAWRSTAFLASTLSRMAWLSLPVFSRKYHPRNHPLVTDRQNPIAVGWRNFEGKGGDVLAIDREKMKTILRAG
ncbi:metal-dependent hydrolase [Oleomonas cavernae]|uniref:Metal-dependent hydrolase n=1 Tax=Oleomonas cavernae TaxID=2320859 RepID=A0A418W8Q5_9PROT|nr:metal-dependent hydrolase [Oleomonas cavernae]RJF86378.1 metal-dependent hydrolase [Oleomonas cavernae]